MKRRRVEIEGLTPDEILGMANSTVEELVLCDRPLVFHVGSAEILGQFRVNDSRLVVELAHIDGGGEGVLPILWNLSERYAQARGVAEVEWIVHAVHCAKPNQKLRRVLVRRGFTVEHVAGSGDVYRSLKVLGE